MQIIVYYKSKTTIIFVVYISNYFSLLYVIISIYSEVLGFI